MSNNKFKVLIIEDEANICSFIQTLLETNGYQALVAQTCVMGMTMFISYNPDLVILDLGLPDRDGLDAIRSIRQILYSRCTRMGKLIPTLIISPPGCGKTTLLRDMIRKISDEGQTVGVVDERSEIGACYQGVAQNDLGIQTDVMDACEKGQGMNMLIRSMAPDVIAVDEIGSKEDVEALFFCAYRGCSILATAHGKNKESLSKNPYMREIINKKMFQRYVILEQRNQPGYIAQIMDENGVVLN